MARKRDAGNTNPTNHATSMAASAPTAAPMSTQTQPGASGDTLKSMEAENLNLIKGMGPAQVGGTRH